MPRRSLESLTITPVPEPQIWPEAPASCASNRQREIWKALVTSREVSYWDSAAKYLLEMLTLHIDAFSRICREMEAAVLAGEADDDRMSKLLRMRLAESGAAATIATRLRLTAQARYTPELGHREAVKGQKAQTAKPWEPSPAKSKRKAAPSKLEQEIAS